MNKSNKISKSFGECQDCSPKASTYHQYPTLCCGTKYRCRFYSTSKEVFITSNQNVAYSSSPILSARTLTFPPYWIFLQCDKTFKFPKSSDDVYLVISQERSEENNCFPFLLRKSGNMFMHSRG